MAWYVYGLTSYHIPTGTIRRGGLTPACGSAYALSSQGCRQIEDVYRPSTGVLPMNALKRAWQSEKRKKTLIQ